MRHGSVMGRAATSRVRGAHVIELRSIFSPLTLVVFLYMPLLLLYAVSSESGVRGRVRQPEDAELDRVRVLRTGASLLRRGR